MKRGGATVDEELPFFVYGTLRPGEKNYPRYLQGRTVREAPASASGLLYFVAEGGYPYVVRGAGRVRGELVEIAPELYGKVLKDLDALEEYDPGNEGDSVYLRRRTRVETDRGTEEAWIYYWNCPGIAGTLIEGGDFRTRGLAGSPSSE